MHKSMFQSTSAVKHLLVQDNEDKTILCILVFAAVQGYEALLYVGNVSTSGCNWLRCSLLTEETSTCMCCLLEVLLLLSL